MTNNKYIVGWINADGTSGTEQFEDYRLATLRFVDKVDEAITPSTAGIKSCWIDSVAGVRLTEWRMG